LSVLQDRPNHMVQWEEVMKTKKQITQLWKQEELYWSQRARVKWLNLGDRNTKFFYASTIQRRDRNKLSRIKDDNGSGWKVRPRLLKLCWITIVRCFSLSPPPPTIAVYLTFPGLFQKI
jgi:hypothetical protein